MGSPLSPIIANLFMEHFKQKALKSASLKPKVWFHYVDDAFTPSPHSLTLPGPPKRDQSSHCIKFTMEEEQDW